MAVGPRLAVPQVQQQQHKQPQPQQQQQPQPPQQQQQPQQQVVAPPPTLQQHSHSITKKAHLIEAQLNLDQSGAVKPDIHTPFRDKKDACIRLIRYHCMDQPVLSQKDLDKADEIFELTAEHFIAKYAKMVDKYKYLLMKESMRPVQTSELMMLDRMFLSEERQSLLRLRQEAEEAAQIIDLPVLPEPSPPQPPEDYDEWACIQRELGCLPHEEPPPAAPRPPHSTAAPVVANAHAHLQPPKRTASSDSRLETLKRFRVDKHNKKTSTESVHNNSVLNNNNSSVQSVSSGINTHHGYEQQGQNDSYENEVENNSIDEQVQSAIDSILNLQQNTALDLDSILS
nr:PREDICTED: glioma tumor suppressor candidate region gene 1 protein [Tribolium castaneum]|eukprot:XP_008195015.1 PREDICTED: glioma tumor suppressor candidate region gene 1 protein [Tribolium castaneum]